MQKITKTIYTSKVEVYKILFDAQGVNPQLIEEQTVMTLKKPDDSSIVKILKEKYPRLAIAVKFISMVENRYEISIDDFITNSHLVKATVPAEESED